MVGQDEVEVTNEVEITDMEEVDSEADHEITVNRRATVAILEIAVTEIATVEVEIVAVAVDMEMMDTVTEVEIAMVVEAEGTAGATATALVETITLAPDLTGGKIKSLLHCDEWTNENSQIPKQIFNFISETSGKSNSKQINSKSSPIRAREREKKKKNEISWKLFSIQERLHIKWSKFCSMA